MRTYNSLLFIIFLSFCIYEFPGYAKAAGCQGQTAIVYSNGIFNDKDDAKKSMTMLELRFRAYPQAFPYLIELEFNLAYADNGGATGPGSPAGIAQLFEAFIQKEYSDSSSFWSWLGGVATAPDWFKALMTDLAVAVNTNAYVDDASLQQQLNGDPTNPSLQPGYQTLLRQGKRVVIVAHSQGNFYANVAYDGLVSKNPNYANRLGIVAVATPANRVGGGGSYITVLEDGVIDFVRKVYPNTLPPIPANLVPPNIAELGLVAWARATFGHNFVEWYLAGTFTRDFILNAIMQTIEKLQQPFAHSTATTFTSSQYSISYPNTYADATRCILDDTNHLGFYTKIIGGYVSISARPLSGSNTYVSSYSDYIPARQQGNVWREAIGILPVPSGVGIVYADRTVKGDYAFNNYRDDYAVFGDTTVHLISYVWDQAMGAWSKQTSQIAMPAHTMSVQNMFCPLLGAQDCSGPVFGSSPGEVPAYYDPVVYQDALYHYGGEVDLPGYQSKMVFGGYVDWQVQGSWLLVSLDNGQLSAGPSGAFSLAWDASGGDLVQSPLIVGVPGRIPLKLYDEMWLNDFTRNNTGYLTTE